MASAEMVDSLMKGDISSSDASFVDDPMARHDKAPRFFHNQTLCNCSIDLTRHANSSALLSIGSMDGWMVIAQINFFPLLSFRGGLKNMI